MPLVTEHSMFAGSSRITAAALGSTSLIGPGLQAAGPPSQLLFIEASFDHAFTGEGISFKAHNIGGVDNDGFDADFEWSFDDPGATYENHGDKVPLPNDRNRALGPIVGHTWLTPGVKTVTCTQRTAGGTATATFQVTVTEPTEDDFDRVLYVSPSGNFDGAPPAGGKIGHITNADALLDLFRWQAGAGVRADLSCWLRFRRGETFDFYSPEIGNNSGVSLTTSTNPANRRPHYWDAWGEGDKPELIFSRNPNNAAGNFFNQGAWAERVVVRDLNFDGGYDPFLNPGDEIQGGWRLDRQRITILCSLADNDNREIRLSFWRCGIKGCGIGPRVISTEGHVYFGDLLVTNWQDYGSLMSQTRTFFVDGGRWEQAEGVVSRNGKEGGDINDPDHGPLRITTPIQWVGVYSVQMRARGGWIQNAGSAVNGRTEQPCIRFTNRREDGDWTGQRAVVVGCYLDGGEPVVSWGTTNSNDFVHSIGRCLVDMCRFRSTGWASSFVQSQFGGLTVRNSIGVVPDVPDLLTTFRAFLDVAPRRPQGFYPPDVIGAPIVLRNNTMVSEQSLANNPEPLNPVRLTIVGAENAVLDANVTEADNLLVGPFRPNAGDLPDWSPLDANYAPLPGSAALGAAGAEAPLRDLSGRLRPSPPSVGALDKRS